MMGQGKKPPKRHRQILKPSVAKVSGMDSPEYQAAMMNGTPTPAGVHKPTIGFKHGGHIKKGCDGVAKRGRTKGKMV